MKLAPAITAGARAARNAAKIAGHIRSPRSSTAAKAKPGAAAMGTEPGCVAASSKSSFAKPKQMLPTTNNSSAYFAVLRARIDVKICGVDQGAMRKGAILMSPWQRRGTLARFTRS